MATYPRPVNALTVETYNDLPALSPIWTLYGGFIESPIEKNAMQAKFSDVVLLKNHYKFQPYSTQGEKKVFDLAYLKEDGSPKILKGNMYGSNSERIFEHTSFVDDQNMRENYSHNDNYIFASWEDAENARLSFKNHQETS